MHLSFDKRMEQQSPTNHQFMTYYKQYKKTKLKRFEAETRLQFKDGTHYTPDAFCTYTNPNGQDHIFALEVYNSKGNHRIKYVVEQLEKLLRIIDHTKKIEQRTALTAIPRILCTLDSKAFLLGVFKRVRSNPFFQIEHIEKLLFFNVDRNVWKRFEK
jgi:hypothetical protein